MAFNIRRVDYFYTTVRELESQEPVKVSVGEYRGYGTSKGTLATKDLRNQD